MALLLVEFSGERPEEVKVKADELVAKLQGQPGLFHALPALEKSLTPEKLAGCFSKLHSQEVIVSMPKFKVTAPNK